MKALDHLHTISWGSHVPPRSEELSLVFCLPCAPSSRGAMQSMLWVCLLPKNVLRTNVARMCNNAGEPHRNSFAVLLLQNPCHCALAHGTWKQSYQNKPFSYKLQVLKIHVIIVLSGSKCAYDAEREQIGLRLKTGSSIFINYLGKQRGLRNAGALLLTDRDFVEESCGREQANKL